MIDWKRSLQLARNKQTEAFMGLQTKGGRTSSPTAFAQWAFACEEQEALEAAYLATKKIKLYRGNYRSGIPIR